MHYEHRSLTDVTKFIQIMCNNPPKLGNTKQRIVETLQK